MLDFETSNCKSEFKLLLENYVTSEGAVSHNVLYERTAPHYSLPSKVQVMLTIILSNYQ